MEKILFSFKGPNGLTTECQLQINAELHLVVCTELATNPGMSIGNCAAEIATAVCQAHELDMSKLIWVERWAHESDGRPEKQEEWSLVTFSRAAGKHFSSPAWNFINLEDRERFKTFLPKH